MRYARLGVVVAAGVLFASGSARADGGGPKGLELGLRSGYAIPLGSISGASGADLSKWFNGVIPIWIDAGYRFSPNMMIGAFFQYGVGLLNTGSGAVGAGCTGGISCSANDLKLGAQLHYHLSPDQSFDPWGGIGVGYEIANFNASQGGVSGGLNVNGFQFFDLQAGGDFKVAPSFALGPFLDFSLGQFSNCGVSGVSTSCNLPSQALHEWLTIGLKGTYDIALGR